MSNSAADQPEGKLKKTWRQYRDRDEAVQNLTQDRGRAVEGAPHDRMIRKEGAVTK